MSGQSATPLGAYVSFPYDRETLEQFRREFPRARWNDDRRNWFVPGKTAERRFARWMDRQLSQSDPFADEKGKDAFEFDPIVSPYLEVADDLRLRTPYSRTIVGELRQIPWAHWDEDTKTWRVPFRSYDDFKKRWATIEAAARRNEPDARKLRRLSLRGSFEETQARNKTNERRRRRYPVPPIFLLTLGALYQRRPTASSYSSGFRRRSSLEISPVSIPLWTTA